MHKRLWILQKSNMQWLFWKASWELTLLKNWNHLEDTAVGGTNIDSYKSPLGYISKLTVLSILLYWNKQHIHNQVVREIMGSCPDRVKSDYRIGTWWFSAKSHSIKEKGQRLFVSESGECVRVGRHVYPRTVVSVS
jgi:hypothetical protein